MDHLYHDNIGLIHLTSSVFALLFGTLVLIIRKGTHIHVRAGYGYCASMAVLLITALMIYRLFNGWGLFHYFTVVSMVTLAAGMIPIWLKKPAETWPDWHLSSMYWSVFGLYAAFVAEVLTRVPSTPFFGMLGVAIFIVMLAANIIFRKKKGSWRSVFAIKTQ